MILQFVMFIIISDKPFHHIPEIPFYEKFIADNPNEWLPTNW